MVTRIFSKLNLGREFVFIGLGQFFSVLISLVGVRVITEVIGPFDFGNVALALTIVMLGQQLFVGPYTNAVARYYSIAKDQSKLTEYFEAVNSVLLKVSVVVSCILLLFLIFGIFFLKSEEYTILVIFTGLFALFSGMNTVLDAVQNAGRQRIVVAIHQVLSQILKYSLIFLLANIFIPNSNSTMAGYAISSVLVLCSQWFFYLKLLRKESGKLLTFGRIGLAASVMDKQFTQYALPFIVWGLFTWIQISSDRWVLKLFATTETVGYYSILYQLGYFPISLLTSVFIQFISPILFERIGDGGDRTRLYQVQKTTKSISIIAFALTIVVSLLFYLLHSFIFRILTSTMYWHVSGYLPYMALAGGLFATGQISTIAMLNSQKPQLLLLPKILTSILGTLLSILLGYMLGLPGVVLSGVIFSAIYLGWVFILAQKELRGIG